MEGRVRQCNGIKHTAIENTIDVSTTTTKLRYWSSSIICQTQPKRKLVERVKTKNLKQKLILND